MALDQLRRVSLVIVGRVDRCQFRVEPIGEWRNWSQSSSLVQQSPDPTQPQVNNQFAAHALVETLRYQPMKTRSRYLTGASIRTGL